MNQELKGVVELNSIEIGKKLKALRGSKSHKEVAEALKLGASTISMYENCERIPRDGIKIKIAEYYNKTVQEIFYDN